MVVTTFAIEELPEHELAGVLAHELSHHLGMHTVALTIRHWLSLPVVVLARVGFWLENVATAATNAFASNSSIADSRSADSSPRCSPCCRGRSSPPCTPPMRSATSSVMAASSRPTGGRCGWATGATLAAALRRVVALGGGQRSVGWRERLAATHPPARTRVARIEAMLRHPAR